jgi:hypothetical protein
MRGLAKMANDVGSNIQSLSVYSNVLSPYSNDIIPWTNISIKHTTVNNGDSRIFIRTIIDFSPSLNYTSYSVSDVFQLFEPIYINIYNRFLYTPYVDEDEKKISTIGRTLSLIHNDWRVQEKNDNNILFYQSAPPYILSNTFKYVIVAIKENNSDKLNKYFFIETNPNGNVRIIM